MVAVCACVHPLTDFSVCAHPLLLLLRFVVAPSTDTMEIEDDRVRLILVGTKAEKGATVRFNVVRWPGTLAGDLRYVVCI